MKNCGAYRGGILKRMGLEATIALPILSPPLNRSLSEFKFIEFKTAAGLALFVDSLFFYLRIILLSFSPQSPHGGQHVPGNG